MKKASVVSSAIIATLAIGVAVGAVFTAKSNFSKVRANPETYSLTFDETHNRFNQSTSDIYSSVNKLVVRNERNTEFEFYGVPSHNKPGFYALDGYWQQTRLYSSFDNIDTYLYNITALNGLSSITAVFEPVDEENYDYRVDVWHSYYFSDTDTYDSTYATCNSITSGVTYNFDGDTPSFFKIGFWNVKIKSIVLTYSCEPSYPDFTKVNHYEMVTSLSQINDTDEYAIGAYVLDGSDNKRWYVINTKEGADFGALEAIEHDGLILEKKNDYSSLRFKILKNDTRYVLQTVNFETNGYVYATTGSSPTLNITENVEQAVTWELSINFDENYPNSIKFYNPNYSNVKKSTIYLNSQTNPKKFALYHQNNYTNNGTEPLYVFKYVPKIDVNFTLNSGNLTGISTKYTTGNYGSLTVNSNKYEFYRAYGHKSDYAFRLIHKDYYYSDHGYPSSFYNTSPIYGVYKLDITYKATSGLKVGYSKDVGVESYQTLAAASAYTTASVTFTTSNFFKIMSNGSDAYVQSIVVHYDDTYAPYNTEKVTYSQNRKSYSVYSGSYTPGVTTKTMYVSATETKTYTYYTYAYVNANKASLNLDAIALTDPVDVCNYFEAFGCAPANYGQTNFSTTFRDGVAVPSRDNVKALFGNKARCMSKYNRTDGYAVAVPFNSGSGFAYYEFDIDTDGTYSVTSRQVGRVVAWDYGFSCYSNFSDRLPVCVYTDDHYATFQEYNNMGGFSPRFDAERNLTGTKHTALTTIA